MAATWQIELCRRATRVSQYFTMENFETIKCHMNGRLATVFFTEYALLLAAPTITFLCVVFRIWPKEIRSVGSNESEPIAKLVFVFMVSVCSLFVGLGTAYVNNYNDKTCVSVALTILTMFSLGNWATARSASDIASATFGSLVNIIGTSFVLILPYGEKCNDKHVSYLVYIVYAYISESLCLLFALLYFTVFKSSHGRKKFIGKLFYPSKETLEKNQVELDIINNIESKLYEGDRSRTYSERHLNERMFVTSLVLLLLNIVMATITLAVSVQLSGKLLRHQRKKHRSWLLGPQLNTTKYYNFYATSLVVQIICALIVASRAMAEQQVDNSGQNILDPEKLKKATLVALEEIKPSDVRRDELCDAEYDWFKDIVRKCIQQRTIDNNADGSMSSRRTTSNVQIDISKVQRTTSGRKNCEPPTLPSTLP